MDFLNKLLPASAQGGGAAGGQQAGAGLLADWQAYSGTPGDVEGGGGAAGAASTSAPASQIAKKAEEVGSSITNLLRSGYSAVSDSLPTTSLENTLPSGQQLVYFCCFMGGGALFLAMAFFVGLPTLLLSPSKFALFFTLGCCFVLAAFASLKGWRSQAAHMLQRERLPFSLGYLASILLTLYAALIMHSYLLSMLCSGLQVVALLYYLTSYYPGGTSSVKFLLSMFGSAASSCFSSCAGMVFGK